ncbi:MAG: undecaprenyldiphospho-muramoylpentapeptide beta-N-acetylglucosaminyltransferase [Syntrophales bacterium]|nr:undecaprenyldiphospho-muramoylpentapeptide beta-N-acetylglucosaminyltransferase [Syntrophales bacterium]
MDRQEIAMTIAGGGTGGHLFPGIAIAEELLKRNPANRVLFIGTNRGLEKKILGGLGFALETINVEGLKGRGPLRVFTSLLKIPGSLLDSLRIIRIFKPDIVVGVGGYASGPAVLAARIMGIKTVIAEQNAVPGLTNRILGRFVERIFVTFAKSQTLFPAGKTVVTGNPIRAAFLSGGKAVRKEGQPFTVLIFGGSQGAGAINQMVMDSLGSLAHLREKICFIHQTGERDRQAVEQAYQKKGFTAEVHPFIIEMAAAYNRADLLVCRAGATSIAEITAVGKAAVLIPLPSAAGDHQTKNAALLADAGAAEMLPEKDIDGNRLASAIERLYMDPDALRKMEVASASLGNKNAAATIINIIFDEILNIISNRR